MSDITLCCNSNWIDDAALSSAVTVGGATVTWVSTLPLANIKTREYAQVARTTSALSFVLTATWTAGHTFSAVALINHNLSLTATVRIQLYSDATRATLVWDSGTIDAWASDEHYWAAFAGNAAAMTTYFYSDNIHVGKLIDITIADAGNTDSYVEIGRIYASNWFQPVIQPEYGAASYNLIDPSESQIVPESGTRYYRKLKKWRAVTINWKDLTFNEVWQEWNGFNAGWQKHGLTGEMLYAATRDRDELGAFYQTFMCQFETLDPLTMPYPLHYECSVNLREIL